MGIYEVKGLNKLWYGSLYIHICLCMYGSQTHSSINDSKAINRHIKIETMEASHHTYGYIYYPKTNDSKPIHIDTYKFETMAASIPIYGYTYDPKTTCREYLYIGIYKMKHWKQADLNIYIIKTMATN